MKHMFQLHSLCVKMNRASNDHPATAQPHHLHGKFYITLNLTPHTISIQYTQSLCLPMSFCPCHKSLTDLFSLLWSCKVFMPMSWLCWWQWWWGSHSSHPSTCRWWPILQCVLYLLWLHAVSVTAWLSVHRLHHCAITLNTSLHTCTTGTA